MPTQVITVRRPRRGLFAVPRAFSDWLRSIWAVLFRTAASDLELAGPRSTDFQGMSTPFFPQLVLDASGSHRCVGCELCVSLCPSRCLTLVTEPEEEESGGLRVTRFELAHGACIGCGLCDEACPEDAIEMVARALVELAPLSGRSAVADLLTRRA